MPKKILVVEDEPGIRLSLSDELESAGYRVFTAENGEKALAIAGREKPDLIILDLMLPVLDGTEVCKKLRMRGDRTPIIMLTVKDKEIDKVLGLELGADDYMTKPFSLRELMARVKAVFRRTEERPSDPECLQLRRDRPGLQEVRGLQEGEEARVDPPGVPHAEASCREKGRGPDAGRFPGRRLGRRQRLRVVPDGRQPYRQYPQEDRGRPVEAPAHPQHQGRGIQVRGMKGRPRGNFTMS